MADPQRYTFLIVDDEPDVLESLRHLFHRRYRVLTASSGTEALRLFDQEPIHVILSDQRMPGMTGDELLSQVRELHPDTIRLLFTGYADIQAVIKAVNQGGIFRYILKPWDVAELETIIGQGADQYNLLAERRRLIAELQTANTQLTHANQELAESDALKSAFLEVASHELNTPITVVQGMSELLKLVNPQRDEPERGIIEQLSESARQLARLVGTMLKLLSANDIRSPLHTIRVDLAARLRDVVVQVGPIVQARRLNLDVEIADDLGTFEIDLDKVRDAVINLLSNAIKFTPDGGQIFVKAWLDGPDDARIEVEDRGIGMDQKTLQHLFQPFFTEFDPSHHSTGDFGFGQRGMGLGLSLVKKFIEMHGGDIRVESTLGVGTKFTVQLPRQPRPKSDQSGRIE
ncbi:MAG: hybrid sensor histidine kinase/response regulator [Isosphaeraceae bacterium]